MTSREGSIQVVLVLLLLVLISFAVYYFFLQNSNLKSQNYNLEKRVADLEKKITENPAVNPYNNGNYKFNNNCKAYGRVPESKFYQSYEVKSGDTLLSVARKQFGSTARVNELVDSNRLNYPQLSVSSPFLEVGWVLKVPSGQFYDQKYPVYGINGEISGVANNSRYFVQTPSGLSGGFEILVTTKIIPESTKFKVGDCVTYIGSQDGTLQVQLQN